MAKPFFYGGQAVLEGVMIRGRRTLSIAVRRPNGEIATSTQPLSTLYTGSLRNIPLVRGVIVLVETLVLGIRALLHSANVALEEEEVEISSPLVWGLLAFTLALGVGLFFVMPLFVMRWLEPHLGSAVLSNILEGLLRLALFLFYLWAISLMPDIRRVFAYHGAEHKTINAFEHGVEMEVSAVQRFGTAHSRCGTAFMLVFLIIALIVFTAIGGSSIWMRLVSRIVLIPVIASVSYEVIRLGATYSGNRIVRAILSPSLALQALTTREPDNGQVEVAIQALKTALEADAAETPA